MPYRIELANSNRAGCQDTVCKNNKEKITKGELRLGTWVEIGDHASWRWRHWGCVSGFTVSNIRESIENGDDEFNWDMIDGWEDLEDHPDIQEKVKRVIKQGHIDPEDFRGDPEFNKPGQKAIRGRAKKAKAEDDDEEDGSPKKKKPAKRGRKKDVAEGSEDEEEVQQPAKKKAKKGGRKSKAAAAADEDEEEQEVSKVAPARAKKPRGGKAAKKAPTPPVDSDSDDNDEEQEEDKESEPEPEPEPEPAPKAKLKRVRKSAKAAAADEDEDEDEKPRAARVVKTATRGQTLTRRGRSKKA